MTVRKNEAGSDFHEISAKATVAITGNPLAGTTGGGLWCVLDTDPNFFVLAGVGADPIGLCDSNIGINASATLRNYGKRLVRLGGTVAALDYGEVGVLGVSVKATGLRPVVGQFLEAGVIGDFVTMLVGKKSQVPIIGADVASAATIVPTGEVFTLTGSTGVTAITATGVLTGKRILILAGTSTAAITLTHMVGGTITLTAGDSLELIYDGTNFVEVGRSVNA